MFLSMKTALILLATTLVGKSLAGNSQDASPKCTNIVFPVTATASNLVIPLTTPITYQQVSGTWNIAARYCEPETSVHSRKNTLQFLVHGITYDRNYWSADKEPGDPTTQTQYSWVEFASKQGFPTLSIDRLGNGLSDHPDPINDIQTPLHVEINHQIIDLARGGKLPIPNGRKFQKIVYIGHSYGSLIGNGMNVKYPTDVDATILTGMTSIFNAAFLNPLEGSLIPASMVNPKWSQLSQNYLAITNQTMFEELFYYPTGFDQATIDYDWSVRGTVGVGELVTVPAIGTVVAPGYKNPILDITGEHDSIFCDIPDPATAFIPWQTYNCGDQDTSEVAATKSLYPNAKYRYLTQGKTGHCLNFHYTALATFGYAHNWLALNQL